MYTVWRHIHPLGASGIVELTSCRAATFYTSMSQLSQCAPCKTLRLLHDLETGDTKYSSLGFISEPR